MIKTGPVIETHQLTRQFGETVAVNGLTLEVYSGEIFGFLGHNGAGKTTTVRLLNGVLAPSLGTARVLGLSPMSNGSTLRRRTGVLTETPSLEERLTAQENLRYYADLYGVSPAMVDSRVDELLTLFELQDRSGDKVGGYSRGMKQRLALARALLHNPEILFLDEPTSGLDPVSSHGVQELISRLSRQEGSTVFLCTHNLVEAQKLCDRVAVLEHGRLIALGTPAELARQLVPSQRLEIEVDPDGTGLALKTLRNSSWRSEVQADGHNLIATGVERETIPALIASLVNAGVKIYRVTPQEPSLEDVYFALHRQQERIE